MTPDARAAVLHTWLLAEIGPEPPTPTVSTPAGPVPLPLPPECHRLAEAMALRQPREEPEWLDGARDRVARLRAAEGAGSLALDAFIRAEADRLDARVWDAEADAFTPPVRGRPRNDAAYALAQVLADMFRARRLTVTVAHANGGELRDRVIEPAGRFSKTYVELLRRAGVRCADWRAPAKTAQDAAGKKKPGAGLGFSKS